MKVSYLTILRQAFESESVRRFHSYHSLAEIKSKLVTSPAPMSLSSSSRDSSSTENPSQNTFQFAKSSKVTANQSSRGESLFKRGEGREQLNQQQKQPQTIENTFNSLTGEQVFKIYSDSKFFADLLSNKGQYPRQIDHLLWRITYLIGEVILLAQSSFIPSTSATLREINLKAFRLVELQFNQRNQTPLAELSNFKMKMLEIYQKGGCSTEEARTVAQFFNKLFDLHYASKQTQSTSPPQRSPFLSENKYTQTDSSSNWPKLAVFAQNYEDYLELPSPSYLQPSRMQVSQVAAYSPEVKQNLKQTASNFQPNFKNYQPKKGSGRASMGAISPPNLYKDTKIHLDKPKSQAWTPFTQSTVKSLSNFHTSNNIPKHQQSFNQSGLDMPQWGLQGNQQWRNPSSGKAIDISFDLAEKHDKYSPYNPHKQKSSNQYLTNNPLQGTTPRPTVDLQTKTRRRGRKPKKGPNKDEDLIVLQSHPSSLNAVSAGNSSKMGLKASKKDKKQSVARDQGYNRHSNTFEIDLNEDEPQVTFRNEIVSSPASIQPIVVPTIASAKNQNREAVAVQKQLDNRQSFGKRMREKWSPEEESLLVKTFIESADEQRCVGALEARFGQHPKWSLSGVKLRLDWIVRKVYQKFKSLKTKNESINRFKQNWEFISKKASSGVRKKLYQDIVAIYTAMLNMSEQKRDVISKKILEINRICQLENKQ